MNVFAGAGIKSEHPAIVRYDMVLKTFHILGFQSLIFSFTWTVGIILVHVLKICKIKFNDARIIFGSMLRTELLCSKFW